MRSVLVPADPNRERPYGSLSADAVQSCDCALPLEPWPPPAAYAAVAQQIAA